MRILVQMLVAAAAAICLGQPAWAARTIYTYSATVTQSKQTGPVAATYIFAVPAFDNTLGTLKAIRLDARSRTIGKVRFGKIGIGERINWLALFHYDTVAIDTPLDRFYADLSDMRWIESSMPDTSRSIRMAKTSGTQVDLAAVDLADRALLDPVSIRLIADEENENSGNLDFATTTRFSLRLTYSYTAFGAGVPEATTWILMILGFGLIGWRLRARGCPRAGPCSRTSSLEGARVTHPTGSEALRLPQSAA